MPTWAILTRRQPVLSHCDVIHTAASPVRLCHKAFGRDGARFDRMGAIPATAGIVPTICCDAGLTKSGNPRASQPTRATGDAGHQKPWQRGSTGSSNARHGGFGPTEPGAGAPRAKVARYF